MMENQPSTGTRSELTGIIRQIRKRWRLKLAIRGAAFVVAGGVFALLVSAYGLERLKFSPGSIIAFRVGMIMIAGALAGYFFVLPQWRRVTDEQVALYLEECEPSLESAILSAIEASNTERSAPIALPHRSSHNDSSNRRSPDAPRSSMAAGSKRSLSSATPQY